jgi:hypothetical protein
MESSSNSQNYDNISFDLENFEKLIFITVFFEKKYIYLLYLLLESLYIYGNLDNKTKILIYTSNDFKNIIENSNLYSDYIIFYTNDDYKIINEAYSARLDLFEIPIISKFKKILYLDCDIIIINDINKIFDLISDNLIYVKNEGFIDNKVLNGNIISSNEANFDNQELDQRSHGFVNYSQKIDFWGNSFFEKDGIKYDNNSGFSSGILLFNNNKDVRDIFKKIKDHILEDRKNNCENTFYDQPYIVYHCKKNNLIKEGSLDNYIDSDIGDMAKNVLLEENIKNSFELKKYVIDDNFFDKENKAILHFNNKPGDYFQKNLMMTNKFSKIKNINIKNIIDNARNYINKNSDIFKNIDDFIKNNIKIIENLLNISLNKNIKNILFVDRSNWVFIIILLFINNSLNIYIIDNSIDNEIFKLLNEDFKNRIFSVIDYSLESKYVKITDKSFDLIYLNKSFDLKKLLLKDRFNIIYNDEVKNNLEEINTSYKFKNINLNLHFLKDYFFKYLIKFDKQ